MNQSAGKHIPLEKLIRIGMGMEGQATDIAPRLGLSAKNYREGRYILMLAADENLSDEHRALVREARAVMNRDGDTHRAAGIVARLIDARWGSGNARKGSGPEHIAGRRMSTFHRQCGAIIQVCSSADEVEVPLLTPQETADWARELSGAIRKAHGLLRRIKEGV